MIRLIIDLISLMLILLIVGCSASLSPPSEQLYSNGDYYYGESVYARYYYDTGYAPAYKYYYDSAYDPWTMGTYYENYAPIDRSDRTSRGSLSSSGSSTEDRILNRSTEVSKITPNTQLGAPSSESSTLRRQRIVERQQKLDISTQNSSSTVGLKTRRDERSQPDQQVQKNDGSQSSSSPNTGKNASSSSEDEKEKRKRKRGVTD